jgi:hypothetical protein
MPDPSKHLGRLISRHAISPVLMQRAVFVVVLAFIFFLAMMFAYYVFQSPTYFLLASAFLLIYIVTMIGVFTQRRNVLSIFERGISYRKFNSRWEEIEAVDEAKSRSYRIRKYNGEFVMVPHTLDGAEQAAARIKALAEAYRRRG